MYAKAMLKTQGFMDSKLERIVADTINELYSIIHIVFCLWFRSSFSKDKKAATS